MARIRRMTITGCFMALLLPAQLVAAAQYPPTIDQIESDLQVVALDSISFDVRATSRDGDIPWLWAESLPSGAKFQDSHEGYRVFSWTPESDQAGIYTIRLIAADASDQTLRSDQRITIVVSGDIDVTAPPMIEAPESVDVIAGENLSFSVKSTWRQGVAPGLIAENLPQRASFTDNGDATRQFNWQTEDADLGTHQITFRAIDPNTLRSSIANVTVRVTSPSLALLDVAELSGEDGFKVVSSTHSDDSLGQAVSQAGDLNGDGLDDIIIGSPGADLADSGIGGAAYVLFGTSSGYPDTFDVESLDGGNGFKIVGNDLQLGEAVGHAGDLNGDGVDDVIVGAQYASDTLGVSTGRVHVVFGKQTDLTGDFPAEIELQALDGNDGFTLDGLTTGDLLGASIDAAGDFNADGIDDIIVGSPQNFFGPPAPGRAYIIYGRSDGFPANWSAQDLDGSNGFEIVGDIDYERVGSAVSGAGDINADGIDDIVIGKGGANLDGTEPNELRAYVLFGRNTATAGDFPASVYVTEIDGYNGFSIGSGNTIGDQASDMRVSGGVDFNADGIDDLVLGEPWFHAQEGRYAGQIYVVYGRDTIEDGAFPYRVDVGSLAGETGSRVAGTAPQMNLGISVSALDDINGDGIGDLVAKASNNNRTYVLYGRDGVDESTLPERIVDMDQTDGFVLLNVADTHSNNSSQRVSGAGDINGDGIADMIIGSPEGAVGIEENGGEVYVIFGTATSPR